MTGISRYRAAQFQACARRSKANTADIAQAVQGEVAAIIIVNALSSIRLTRIIRASAPWFRLPAAAGVGNSTWGR